MRIRLGGWQRLWLVVAGLYGVGIAVYVWQKWPVRDARLIHEYTFRENETGVQLRFLYYGPGQPSDEQIEAVSAAQGRRDGTALLREIRRKYPGSYDDLQDEKLLAATDEAFPGAFKMGPDGMISWKTIVSATSDARGRTVYFPAGVSPVTIQEQIELLDAGAWTPQKRLLLGAATTWLVPQIALGALIFAGAWVVRGFRQGRDQPT